MHIIHYYKRSNRTVLYDKHYNNRLTITKIKCKDHTDADGHIVPYKAYLYVRTVKSVMQICDAI